VVERAVAGPLDKLRAVHPAAADLLAQVLRDATLTSPLTAKPLSALATQLLDSLSNSSTSDADR
jgi:hypothetical protein